MAWSEYLDLLKRLVRVPCVVGAEHPFFRELTRELEEVGATVTLYEGLLVAQGNNPDCRHISAHIDRHGLICTGPNEFQYAAYIASNRGDLLGDSISEQMFKTISSRFQGEEVIAYEPWSGLYLGNGQITDAAVCERRGNMIFTVEGMEDLIAGMPVAFQDRLTIDEGRLTAQLDNIVTAAMLVYLFHQGFQGTAFFTAQEEAGRSWRYLWEWYQRHGIESDNLLVLDTSPFPDEESADKQQIVLRRKDANAEFDEASVQLLVDACDKLGHVYTFKDDYIQEQNARREEEGLNPMSFGRTELGRIIMASDGKVTGTTLQVPTTGYHTPNESASVDAVKAFLEVLKNVTL